MKDDKALPIVDALLFIADREEHLETVIKPALSQGKIVVCERYHYSTLAYQSVQGLDTTWLEELNSFIIEPNLVILLDLDPEIAFKRTFTHEKFEKKEFLKQLRQKYLNLAEKYPYFSVINAEENKEKVQQKIRNVSMNLF